MADTQLEFRESQKFTQPWLWFILLIVNGLTLYGIFSNPYSIGPFLITIGITLIIFFSRLDTQVNKTGIHYRFKPYFNKWKVIKWLDVRSVKIKKYNAISEFGGFGIRINFSGNKAFNTSGNTGLDITLKNNKKILIGTQKPDELENIIERLKME
ncbi:MAG: hypothetical protein CMO01_30280 [Thalassobius sp.]|nr:hypothetical protein [Thalassovita sp.]